MNKLVGLALLGLLVGQSHAGGLPGNTSGRPSGVIALFKQDKSPTTHADILADSAWANNRINIYAYRVGWNLLETSPDVYDWHWIDDIMAKAAAKTGNGTTAFVGLYVFCGGAAPSWLYTAPTNAYKLTLSNGVQPLPWDTVFLARWQRFLNALGAKYNTDPHLCYMQMEGLSYNGECNFCITQADVTAALAAPGSGGSESAMATTWENAGKTITSYYLGAFPTSGRSAYVGPPTYLYPPLHYFWAAGQFSPNLGSATYIDMLANSTSGLMKTYPEIVGTKNNGLWPGSNSWEVQNGQIWLPTNPIGFQTTNPQDGPSGSYGDLDSDFDLVGSTPCGNFVEEITGGASSAGLNKASSTVISDGNVDMTAP